MGLQPKTKELCLGGLNVEAVLNASNGTYNYMWLICVFEGRLMECGGP